MNRVIPFTNLKIQHDQIAEHIDAAIRYTIDNSSFITGPDVIKFEQALADYVGVEACASTGSCTTALQVALKACEIPAGSEVITTSLTFVSTVEVIVNHGALPIMVDIDDYFQMDPDLVEQAITDRTSAIIAMDAYGQSCDIARLRDIADRHGLKLICDSAHSFGSRAPLLADLTCYSFNPIKNLGAMGDAGAVVGSTALIEQARMYRDHGRNTKFVFEKVGFNARIDNMQSNILLAKLPYLENWNKQRQMIATRYDMYLDDVVRTPRRNGLSDHVYYVYVIRTIQRDQLQQYLKQAGITTNIHYPKPCHTQPAFADHYSPLPRTEAAVDEILSLPCYPGLSRSDQDYIIEHVRKFFT